MLGVHAERESSRQALRVEPHDGSVRQCGSAGAAEALRAPRESLAAPTSRARAVPSAATEAAGVVPKRNLPARRRQAFGDSPQSTLCGADAERAPVGSVLLLDPAAQPAERRRQSN